MLQIHDLKRQTALRLAQEQEQSRGQSMEGGMQILPPDQGQLQYYGAPQAFAPVDPNRVAQDARMFNAQPAENRSFSRYEGQGMADMNRNNQMQYVPNRSNPAAVPNNVDQGHQRTVRTNRPGSSLSAGSANSFGSGSTERKGKSKPKLPHGLTVQELKEMTKARLQAEASEGVVEPENQPSNLALQQHPYGRGAGEAVSPLGFVVQDPSRAPGTPLGFQGRMSPHTPNGSMIREGGMTQPRDLWQQSSGLEGWETGSVASTQNSEYLGSESPYSSAFQRQDDFPGVPFNRSRSYGGGYEQPESQSPYFASSSPFADLNSCQNRRRASTLSPRPVPGLTYLHEDRPLGNTATNVGLPAFDSAVKPRPRVRTINSDTFHNEPNSQSSSPTRLWASPIGGVIGGGLSNRPRTASAPTVRSVSQPSDEFLGGGNVSLARPPSTHSLGLGGEISGDLSNTAFDSALGFSTGGGGNGGNDGFSSVFRQPAGIPRPPPGFFPNNEPPASGMLIGSRSNDFGWDDGWGNPSLGSRNQEYQPRERSHTDGEALLADSLGSMLNLSANREASLGHNTFVSRIDPEIDFNRRRAASSPVPPTRGTHQAFSAPNSVLFDRGGAAFRDDRSGFM